ncbi:pyridoxal-phosphate dependent enzyme [Gilliamella sp. Choc5-1]|uniref:pyridoxal-phosphate dependent enzyme n=1 Tax=Gilliamella sp. Choc5-1 TaxID=3120238 RepID=UPI0009BE6639|nr:pyridoxal-phosphate dependent enzyme [Gilliamella apicola]
MGNTPIVKLKNIFDYKKAPIFVKLEEFNPGGSVKSRPGKFMVVDAHQRGILNNKKIILEATGGNTDLGITLSAINLGYKVHLVIPDNFSREKIKTLESYGAKIILSDHKTGPGSHIRLAKKILESENKYINLDQFSNPVDRLH